MYKKRGRRSQVWIETVIYTLIGLTIIGLLIGLITPRINQMKDRAIIGQTIESMTLLNNKIMETLSAPGNTRQINLGLSSGEYVIDSLNETISYSLKDTNLLYTEVGQVVPQGEINVLTVDNKGKYNIFLILNYGDYNLTYEDKDINKTLTPASNSYGLLIENKGGADKRINFRLIS